MSDDERLTKLERELDELRREVAALRGERLTPPPPPPPAPARPPRRTAGRWLAGQASALGLGTLPHDRAGVEAVVGRYGTVALAALLILMGVGAFLTWAVGVITIGPRTRVALGAVACVALGAFGAWVRRRERGGRFGDVVLALALAVAHVDAWGAGPYLGLVPPGVSLTIAAVASAALALLAWRERDQPLFVVGVGGALVAPFVTSAGAGRPYVLVVYGWLVLTSGALALPRDRRWPFAARLLGVGAAVYAAAAAGEGPIGHGPETLPALFALLTAAGALAVAGPAARGWLALAHLATTAGAVVAVALQAAHGVPGLPWLAAAADALTYAALARTWRDTPHASPARAATTAVLLPLALLAGALVALPDAWSSAGAAVGAGWAALAAGALYLDRRDDRLLGAHVAVAGLASALVPALLLRDARVPRAIALAAHATAFALAFARARRRVALLPALAVLCAASLEAYLLLWERPAFRYAPFLTPASLAAAAVVAGWVATARLALRSDALSAGERGLVAGVAAAAAVGWGREELARAGSAEVATFLLVGYFAAAGILAILAGRVRRVPAARQAGLALALYAALKALVQASGLAQVGLRVGSYLLVGAFLLGVGWWYRAAGDGD